MSQESRENQEIKKSNKNHFIPLSGVLEGRYSISVQVEGAVILLPTRAAEWKRKGLQREPWWMTAQFSGQIWCLIVRLSKGSFDRCILLKLLRIQQVAGWFIFWGFWPYRDFLFVERDIYMSRVKSLDSTKSKTRSRNIRIHQFKWPFIDLSVCKKLLWFVHAESILPVGRGQTLVLKDCFTQHFRP